MSDETKPTADEKAVQEASSLLILAGVLTAVGSLISLGLVSTESDAVQKAATIVNSIYLGVGVVLIGAGIGVIKRSLAALAVGVGILTLGTGLDAIRILVMGHTGVATYGFAAIHLLFLLGSARHLPTLKRLQTEAESSGD